MKCRERLIVVAAAWVLTGWVQLSTCGTAMAAAAATDEGAAKSAYDAAYKLESQLKTAEAATAYQKFLIDYPESRYRRTVLSQLAGTQAALGQPEEAYKTYERFIREDLAAARTRPEDLPSDEAIRCQARMKVAQALLGSFRPDRAAAAKDQYAKVVQDFPNTAQARIAQEQVVFLETTVATKTQTDAKRAAIEQVVKQYSTALKDKNAAAALALLAEADTANQLKTKLDQYFASEGYKAYTYKLGTVRFNDDLSQATVIADAVAPDSNVGKKLFRLVETAGGWKLKNL